MFSFIDKYYTKKFTKFYLRYSLFINFQTYSIIGFVSFLSKRIKCVLEIFNIRRVYSPSTFSSLFICTINAFKFLCDINKLVSLANNRGPKIDPCDTSHLISSFFKGFVI